MRRTKRRLLPGALVVVACGTPGARDAGTDAGRDAGDAAVLDAGIDAGRDASVADSGSDGGADGGFDAGTDAGNPCPDVPINDAGMRCTCETVGILPDGGLEQFQCCDPDLGNPCPVCCFNPRTEDGGRQYSDDAGTPTCYC